MSSKWHIVLALLATAPNLSAQNATPPSNSQSISSDCDSILKPTASPRFRGGRLKHKDIPEYPEAARDANLDGKVQLSATIGKDGKVKDVSVLEGDSTLANAAAQAVKKWRYEPFRLDNVAVDVPTVITVNFALDGQVGFSQQVSSLGPSNSTPPSPTVGNTTHSDPIYSLGGDVKPPISVFSPDPSYAESARKAKKQGSVVLGVVVTAAGAVGNIEVCRSLDSALDQKAVEAVTQWKFQPGTKDGKPVAVRVSVEVNFRLYR